MQLSVGQKLNGFTVVRVRSVEELKSTLVEMQHDKTGAQLAWMDNGDSNKLFSVAFKTLPEDHTGVFHILEHSVLGGSRKFPVKEPFLDLLKGSMQTFLNAMTFNDKTIDPVSSRNEQDFLNLTEVYLDAVFAPLVGWNIFWQEGWHPELDEQGNAVYKGVVFNEMKGAMANVYEVIDQDLREMLFPDSCYQYNSGGEPEHIPELTYEKYLEFYHRFYHPSNARFYLDGTVPIERTLALIDSYLAEYDRSDNLPEITMQQPVAAEETRYYEISPEDAEGDKAHFAMARILTDWSDKTRIYAAMTLCDMLAGSNEAPLKKAVLEAGLAQDFDLDISDGTAQSFTVLAAHNMDDARSGELQQLVKDTLRRVAEEGLNKEALTASLNMIEFKLRTLREPAGLIRNIRSLDSWLYGGDVLQYLLQNGTFEELRAMLDNGGFEALYKEIFLDEGEWVKLHLLPSTTLGDEKREREAERLAELRASWTEEEKAEIIRKNAELAAWQQAPDSPELAATLPKLDLSEVGPDPEWTESQEFCEEGVKGIFHPVSSNGITYLTLYFNLSDLSLEELTNISILPRLLGNLPTKTHPDTADLQLAVKTYLGEMAFMLDTSTRAGDRVHCTPWLVASCSVLDKNLAYAKKLLYEVLTETVFDAKDSIRKIVLQNNESAKQYAIMAGNALAQTVAKAHYSAGAAVGEALNGYTNLQYLHDFADHFDERFDDFKALVERVMGQSVCRARLFTSMAASDKAELGDLFARFEEGTPVPEQAAYTTTVPDKLGITIPAQIGFAVRANHLDMMGGKADGSLQVACTLLRLDYLWNTIRVQGGAYGTGVSAGMSGMTSVFSYRDPTPARSLGEYARMGEVLEAYCKGDDDLVKYIISTVGSTDRLAAPLEKSMQADTLYMAGYTYEDMKRRRIEMLETTKESLAKWAEPLRKLTNEGSICVVGHTGALEACSEYGLQIVEL